MGKPETARKYLEDGIRTRGSQRPDDSQGRGADMAQEDGAFKVNPPVYVFGWVTAGANPNGADRRLLEFYTGMNF